jgi:hypothetical protein
MSTLVGLMVDDWSVSDGHSVPGYMSLIDDTAHIVCRV